MSIKAKKDSNNSSKVNINFDTTPILYTDNINIQANKDGVILNVMQKLGNNLRIVSRIGMSREHAREFVNKMGNLMIMTESDDKKSKKDLN